MSLGNFSVSLTVKDLAASRAFYEALGFQVFHDQSQHGWMILKGSGAIIGLFQGMFDRNILTFNPGWDENGQPVEGAEDVRDIQKRLKAAGITPVAEVDEDGSGPGRCLLHDPDGNPVLLDQHV